MESWERIISVKVSTWGDLPVNMKILLFSDMEDQLLRKKKFEQQQKRQQLQQERR